MTQQAVFLALSAVLGLGAWLIILGSVNIRPGLRWKLIFFSGVLTLNIAQLLLPITWQWLVNGLDVRIIAAGGVVVIFWTGVTAAAVYYISSARTTS